MGEQNLPASIGDIVDVIGTVCVTNSVGGTTLLKHGGIRCEIVARFYDEEIGWIYHARVNDESAVEDFRRQSTSQFTPEHYRQNYPHNPQLYEGALKASKAYDPSRIHFTEHDLALAPVVIPGGPNI